MTAQATSSRTKYGGRMEQFETGGKFHDHALWAPTVGPLETRARRRLARARWVGRTRGLSERAASSSANRRCGRAPLAAMRSGVVVIPQSNSEVGGSLGVYRVGEFEENGHCTPPGLKPADVCSSSRDSSTPRVFQTGPQNSG